MRKLLSYVCLAVISIPAVQAQVNKGSIFIGGNINYYQQKVEGDGSVTTGKHSSFYAGPSLGIAVKENLLTGLEGFYGSVNQQSSELNSDAYGAGVFARQYFPFAKRLFIYAHGSLGAGKRKESLSQVDNTRESNNFNMGLHFYPGLSFQLSKSIQLETGLNNLFYLQYDRTKSDAYTLTGVSHSKIQSFSAGINSNPFANMNIGFRILLNR